MLIHNETKFPDIVVRSIRSAIKIGVKVIKKVAFFAPKHVDIIELTCDMKISLLTILSVRGQQVRVGYLGNPSRIYPPPGTTAVWTRVGYI